MIDKSRKYFGFQRRKKTKSRSHPFLYFHKNPKTSCVYPFYPITTSKTIISTNPMAKPIVLRLECSPDESSGISSSTTTSATSATCLSSRIVRQVSGEKSYGFKNLNFALSGSSKALQLFKYDKRSSNERPYSVWPKWCIFSITLM